MPNSQIVLSDASLSQRATGLTKTETISRSISIPWTEVSSKRSESESVKKLSHQYVAVGGFITNSHSVARNHTPALASGG